MLRPDALPGCLDDKPQYINPTMFREGKCREAGNLVRSLTPTPLDDIPSFLNGEQEPLQANESLRFLFL